MDKQQTHGAATIIAVLSLACLTVQPGVAAPAYGKLPEPPASRLIVKFRTLPDKTKSAVPAARRITTMAAQAGVGMNVERKLSGGAHLVAVNRAMAPAELAAIARHWSRRPDIEYAEPDALIYPRLRPNDPLFARQYYLKGSAVEPGAINTPGAWDVTTGSEATVVAVIDSGILFNHVDIHGRTLPGYDFIGPDPGGGFSKASDGNGRDDNPSDPGAGGACARLSIWHGTRVASLIGAVTNDGQGMAAVDWSAKILPVRAISDCGGYTSDFNDAIRWAAGLPVPGVPDNPNPARVINLSFGALGPATCLHSQQEAIDDSIAAGALVVTAAGNSATNELRTFFNNCKGVLSVAATARDGGLAPTSSFGVTVGLSAPGVDILTAANKGTQAPIENGDIYTTESGTSLSSPLVAGAASLMLSLNDSLTPQQLIATLRATARPFPAPAAGQRCSDSLCGAGVLDAAAAVRAVAAGNIAPPGDGDNGLRAAFAAATPLTPGVSRQGALSQPYQFDVYRLSLPADGSLSVATAGGTDTYGYLFDANGKLLDQVDDIVAPRSPADPRANLNFRIDNTLSAGTYYVAVEGFSSNTRGPYALSAKFSGQSGGGGGGAMDLLLSIALLTGLSGALRQRDRARQRTHARWAANAAAPPTAP